MPDSLELIEQERLVRKRTIVLQRLEQLLQQGLSYGEINAQGGTFCWSYRMLDAEDAEIIKDYFARQGWQCFHTPRNETWWKRKTSHYDRFVAHYFTVRTR